MGTGLMLKSGKFSTSKKSQSILSKKTCFFETSSFAQILVKMRKTVPGRLHIKAWRKVQWLGHCASLYLYAMEMKLFAQCQCERTISRWLPMYLAAEMRQVGALSLHNAGSFPFHFILFII